MKLTKKTRVKTPFLTYILIIINLIIFALEIKQGGSQNPEVLYDLGGLVPVKVQEGEWWRIVTANFLHFGHIHLLTNMIALYLLGRFVELQLGRTRYLVLYLVSGIGSMGLYTLIAIEQGKVNQVLIGASAAIMGLLGGIIALSFYAWLVEKSTLAAKRLVSLLLIVSLQFFIDFNTPQVSFLGHLLGLLIGFSLGLLFTFYRLF